MHSTLKPPHKILHGVASEGARRTVQVAVFEIAGDRIQTIRFINNRHKLKHLHPPDGSLPAKAE
jgi:hypothetical protein